MSSPYDKAYLDALLAAKAQVASLLVGPVTGLFDDEEKPMTTLKPIDDRVLIRRAKDTERRTPSGLHIPEVSVEKLTEGEVIAVGDGKLLENGTRLPPTVAVGDCALFGKYAGADIKLDGEDYVVMRQDEIFGIVSRSEGASAKA